MEIPTIFRDDTVRNGRINEDNKRLTLNEMYDIFQTDVYKKFHAALETKDNGERNVRMYLVWGHPRYRPLLYRHIIAEQLLQADYHDIDWDEVGAFDPGTYFPFVELLVNPLVWKDASDYEDIVIEGRLAAEKYDSNRVDETSDLLNYINTQSLLNLADHGPYTIEEDETDMGYVKGMHEWGTLTCNYTDIFMNIINGGHVEYEDIRKAKYYDGGTLRYGLSIIAEHRSGKRALEILRMLQEEWPKIKLWKTYFDTMKEDEIRQFEEVLFHGFDDLLEEWEGGADAQKEQPKTIKKGKNQSISKSQSFDSLLQCPKEQKGHVLSRLHDLLDGKGGKHVAIILMAAKQKYSLLLDIPTENQYTSEFALSGSWRAVTNYIKKHTLVTGKYSENLDHISIL